MANIPTDQTFGTRRQGMLAEIGMGFNIKILEEHGLLTSSELWLKKLT
jgi:hypothetical protein